MKKRQTTKVKPGPSSTLESTHKISEGASDYASYLRSRISSERLRRIGGAVSFKKTLF